MEITDGPSYIAAECEAPIEHDFIRESKVLPAPVVGSFSSFNVEVEPDSMIFPECRNDKRSTQN